MTTAHVELHTDDRVTEVVELFRDRPEWSLLGKIDSANYGEGFDLQFRGEDLRGEGIDGSGR